MNAKEVKKMFIAECGGLGAYRKMRNADYCKAQFEWSCFIDNLCRDGVISQRTYDTITF